MNINKAQKIINRYWLEYCEVFPRLVKFDCPIVKFNNRFTSTAGRADLDDNILQLCPKYFEKYLDRIVCEIIPHEIAHFIDFHFNKPHFYHGKTWKLIMIKINQAPNMYHNMHLKK